MSTRPVNTWADAVAAKASAKHSAAATAVSLLVLQFMPSDPPQKNVQKYSPGIWIDTPRIANEAIRARFQQNVEVSRGRH